jgi:hypothetical protein
VTFAAPPASLKNPFISEATSARATPMSAKCEAAATVRAAPAR